MEHKFKNTPAGKIPVDWECRVLMDIADISDRGRHNIFYPYLLRSKYKELERLGAGSAFQEIPKSALRILSVPVPPLAEQKKIAEIMTSVDDAIEKMNAVIEKTKELVRNQIQLLIYGGLDQKNLQNTIIGQIPETWQVVTLEQVASVERGKFQHRPRNEPGFYGGKYPFVQTGEVANSGGHIYRYSQTLNEDGLAISRLFPKGTILITIAENIGETAIADMDVAFPDSLIGIITNDNMDNRFLEYYLRTRKLNLASLAIESASKNINLETLRAYPVPLPPKQEQITIADLLENIEKGSINQKQSMQKLNELQSALMGKLLTGQLRVRV